MSKELRECPFCGGEAVIYQNYNEYGVWSVSCDACHVEMVSGVRSILVSVWNTRPAVDAKPAERKQITEILHGISADNARMSRVYGVVREKNKKLTAEVERLKAENDELRYIVEQFSKWTAEGGCVKANFPDFPCWWERNRIELELDDYCDSEDEIEHKCWVEYYRWKFRQKNNNPDTGKGGEDE